MHVVSFENFVVLFSCCAKLDPLRSRIMNWNFYQIDLKLLIDGLSDKLRLKQTDFFQLDVEGCNKTVYVLTLLIEDFI